MPKLRSQRLRRKDVRPVLNKNILELCLSSSFGGLEIHMRDFSRWLSQQSDATLHLAVRRDSRIHESLKELSVAVMAFASSGGAFPVLKARKLARFIDEHNIDVVHVHWKNDLALGALAKRLSRRRPSLVHTRQMSLPGKKFDPYHRFIYGSLDRFIAITQLIARQAELNLPMARERIRQISYGVHVPAVAPEVAGQIRASLDLEGKFVVGVVGRIAELKGQHLLIEAIDLLRKKEVVIYGVIMGEPFDRKYANDLRILVEEKQLANQVRFLEFHPRPYEVMSCFDVLALTSKHETFGLVLVEAMHCGVAVIGSNAEGVPEIIDNELTGLLFHPWTASALADAIERLQSDGDLRMALAQAGQSKAKSLFESTIQYKRFYAALRGE
jgi:glycosyltransferase involved in cell wall biosynthesis